MADALFEEPRLAEIYDAIDDDRSDLEVYAAIVDELGAHVVLDVGCGTGTFACMLAAEGRRLSGSIPRQRRWMWPAASLLRVESDGSKESNVTPPGARRSRDDDGRISSLRCVTRHAARGSTGPGRHRPAGSTSQMWGESRRGRS